MPKYNACSRCLAWFDPDTKKLQYNRSFCDACDAAYYRQVGEPQRPLRRNPELHSNVYSTRRWRDTRVEVLSREPRCLSCLSNGFIHEASVVDHIQPLSVAGISRAFDRRTLQPLCKGCHDGVKKEAELRQHYPRYLDSCPIGDGLKEVPQDVYDWFTL